jgi:hypothetical protein
MQQRQPAPDGVFSESLVDGQVADMRTLLALMREANATDALAALRAAFPGLAVPGSPEGRIS